MKEEYYDNSDELSAIKGFVNATLLSTILWLIIFIIIELFLKLK